MRTHEIEVRVALGASRGRVLSDMLVGALKLVVPGIGLGLLVAALFVRQPIPLYSLGGIESLVHSLAAATVELIVAIRSE